MKVYIVFGSPLKNEWIDKIFLSKEAAELFVENKTDCETYEIYEREVTQ